MKKFTKTLSIVLLIAMCMSMFTIGAFAEGVHVCGTEKAYYEGAAATCIADGSKGHWQCSCGKWYKDEACTQYVGNADELKIPAIGHANKKFHAASSATCAAQGNIAYYSCPDCGKFFSDAECNNEIQASDPVLTTTHQKGTQHAAVAPDCYNAGTVEYFDCSFNCGAKLDASGNVLASIEVASTGHNYNTNGICVDCGNKLSAADPFDLSGVTPAAFTADKNFVYDVNDPSVYTVTGVSAGGYPLYEGVGFSYAHSTGKVTVYGSAVASLISGKSSIELTFTAYGDGKTHTKGGFYLNNQTTTENLKVDGFEQRGFIKGSTEAVTFKTNDSNANNVKLYSTKTQNFVDLSGNGSYPLSQVGGMYTYTFGKAFLDTLDAGTYYVQCYYGASNYVTAGTIVISLSNSTTGDTSLTFTNSTVSNTEYKYVSGGAGPKLFSTLFRDKACVLQVSTNGGTSWQNVSVYDYYIEQSNNKSTSYAWIKTAYLDNMPASSNVYFRVIVPASATGTTTDLVSNWIKVTTGNTLAAVDTSKHVINSSKNLKFVSSAKIATVYVGNINLTQNEPNAYSLSSDGKYVTLHAEFLNKRTAGSTYTLTVVTTDGEKLSTTFQILTTAQASASPRTGDDSNIALWSAFLLLSGAAVVAVLPRLKKEQ